MKYFETLFPVISMAFEMHRTWNNNGHSKRHIFYHKKVVTVTWICYKF